MSTDACDGCGVNESNPNGICEICAMPFCDECFMEADGGVVCFACLDAQSTKKGKQ